MVRGDARNLPLPDASVDLIVTSPPYFALRSYTDGGEHYDGQIGSEPTPAEYVAALVDCTREWVRVLKPSGSLWVNLGDKYSQRPGQFGPQGSTGARATRRQAATYAAPTVDEYGAPPKSLIGLPWRYALACIDQLGLILRAEVIWSKPNGLPESVTDRVRRSHEQWFHMVKQPRYYSAVDEIREEHAESGLARRKYAFAVNDAQRASRNPVINGAGERPANPLGKLPGSVWEIPSEPLKVPDPLGVDHFAAFPTEWPKRLVAGWSPPGICVECGEGRRPASERTLTVDRGGRAESVRDMGQPTSGRRSTLGRERVVSLTGYACACPEPTAPTRPAVVLDPFGGTGTTALVASTLGRFGITVDRSADYCRLAGWRTTDGGQVAKVLGVAKPPVQVDGQLGLFEGVS